MLAIWGLVILSATSKVPTTSDTSVPTVTTFGPLSLYSTCQLLNDATTDQLHNFDEVWPEAADEANAACAAHPDWTITQAIIPPKYSDRTVSE